MTTPSPAVTFAEQCRKAGGTTFNAPGVPGVCRLPPSLKSDSVYCSDRTSGMNRCFDTSLMGSAYVHTLCQEADPSLLQQTTNSKGNSLAGLCASQCTSYGTKGSLE